MGLREDDPVYYKVQMQKLLNKARKNGLVVDYSFYDGPKERGAKILFRDPASDDCGSNLYVTDAKSHKKHIRHIRLEWQKMI